MMIVYIVGFCLFFSVKAKAESEKKLGVEGFAFEVIQPENQQNKEVGYFDLHLNPGQKQMVQMKLKNTSEEQIVLGVALNSAKTNSNGVIEYGPNNIPNDSSLKYDFSTIVEAPKEVTLAPKSETMLDLNIKMPEEAFEGYISGGIQLQEKDQDIKKENKGMIINKFAYLTGMLLSNSDSKNIEPKLEFNKIYPELSNYRNAIFVNFSNVTPIYVNDMTTEVTIMKKNSESVIYETKKTKMRMAPNTTINFPVPMNGEKMMSGDYKAKILVTTLSGGRWEWEKTFTISNDEAEKFNEQDLTLTQDSGVNWLLVGLIIATVLLLALLIFLLIRMKNKKKRTSQKQQNKKRKNKNERK
ncbi:DUF916 and DUF3324 domain-containing protein [Enterococcus rivorum]|nr:DUF916 and DUF3324 domain-containing protein [Enterococcus rivorum]